MVYELTIAGLIATALVLGGALSCAISIGAERRRQIREGLADE